MFHASYFRLGTFSQVNYCDSKWTRALKGWVSKPVNGQNWYCINVHAGVPQGSVLDSFSFLIYINDNLSPNVIFFADDTLISPIVQDVKSSAKELNDDVKKVNDWTLRWKMSFNQETRSEIQFQEDKLSKFFSFVKQRHRHIDL